MYTTLPWQGIYMACTLNALLLSIQTMKVYVFQTMCHGFPLVELVQGPRRKFCRLPDSMLIRLHDTGGILMPCNALKRKIIQSKEITLLKVVSLKSILKHTLYCNEHLKSLLNCVKF